MKQGKKLEKKTFRGRRRPNSGAYQSWSPTHPHFTDIASLFGSLTKAAQSKKYFQKQHKNWDNKNTKLISPHQPKNSRMTDRATHSRNAGPIGV
jgi:hypothetical protein